MVTAVKHEWHQVDRQYCIEIDEDLLSEIYPDLDEDEIADKLQAIETGYTDIEEVLNDAYDNDIDIDWDHQYDDCWTDRKGGYEVTYELGDEDSWHHTPPPPEPTHKCTKCKWEGQGYETDLYFRQDENSNALDEAKKVCPMCESDTELTEAGIEKESDRQKLFVTCNADEDDDIEDSPERQAELEAALEELKREFDELMTHTHKCAECEWTGTEEQCDTEGICPNCAAHTEDIEREDD